MRQRIKTERPGIITRGRLTAQTILGAGREPSTMNTYESPESADHGQVLSSENGVWYETPGRFSHAAERDGADFGTVRMPAEQALGPQAAPNRSIAGGVGVRKAAAKQDTARQIITAAQRVASAAARKAEANTKLEAIRQRLNRLVEEVLAPLRARLEVVTAKTADCKTAVDNGNREFLSLPRMFRGYIDTIKPVIFVACGVVVFDAFVLHGALENSGLSSLTVWGTSLTVPLAIAGSNEAFGLLAGAIATRVPAHHTLKLAATLFMAGLGSLVVAFLTLMVFRAEAVAAMNHALAALAAGHQSATARARS